jgi:hypothetical protein
MRGKIEADDVVDVSNLSGSKGTSMAKVDGEGVRLLHV